MFTPRTPRDLRHLQLHRTRLRGGAPCNASRCKVNEHRAKFSTGKQRPCEISLEHHQSCSPRKINSQSDNTPLDQSSDEPSIISIFPLKFSQNQNRKFSLLATGMHPQNASVTHELRDFLFHGENVVNPRPCHEGRSCDFKGCGDKASNSGWRL